MNDAQLESLLLAANEATGAPSLPSPELANRARNVHVRRGRRRGRAKIAAALAACYLAGILTMWTAAPFVGTNKAILADGFPSAGRSAELNADAPARAQRDLRKQDSQAPMRMQAPSIAETSRYELLRQMGDECHRRGDFQTAISFYGKALDAATDVEQEISYEQDSWLLISLKKDHRTSQHARTYGDSI